jgi:hypothetical protein
LQAATRGKLAARDLLVVPGLTDAIGSIAVPADRGAVITPGEAEPIAGVALHYADLRRR